MSQIPLIKNNKINQTTTSSEYVTTVIQQQKQSLIEDDFNRYYQKHDINPQKKKVIDEFYTKQMTGQYSLFTNPAIHPAIRYLMFITLICTTGLFIWSNLSIGAKVLNYGVFAGLRTKDNSLGQLTFLHSIGEMWNAGVYVLAGLIAFGSGAWPYMKLIMLMACLTVKEKYLNFSKREIILVILDAAGKWALVDAYVMFILAVGFRYDVDIPIPGISIQENVVVKPVWGFYSFLAACLLSLIITHIMIYQHRSLRKRPINPNYKTQSLLSSSRIRASGTVILYVITFGFVIYGIICNSFYFEFQGLGAIFYTPEERRTEFSIISVIMKIRETSYNEDSFGVIYQTILFFTLSLILTFLFLVLLGVLLLVPMKLDLQRKLSQIVEIVYAWATLDVMTLTIIVTSAETEKFSEFNLGNTCDGINQLIVNLNNSILPINIQPPICFLVVSGLTEGMVYLGIAATLFLIQGAVIIRLLKTKLDKKIQQYFEDEPLYQGKINYTNFMIMKSKQNSMLRMSIKERSFQIDETQKSYQKV